MARVEININYRRYVLLGSALGFIFGAYHLANQYPTLELNSIVYNLAPALLFLIIGLKIKKGETFDFQIGQNPSKLEKDQPGIVAIKIKDKTPPQLSPPNNKP